MVQLLKKSAGLIMLVFALVISTVPVLADEIMPEDQDSPHIWYQVYQGGWSEESADRQSAVKSPGSSVDGVKIRLSGVEGSVLYRVYLSNGGWQDWESDGAVAGGENTGNAIEAIQIKLGGYAGKALDVVYRASSREKGQMGWAIDGQPAGSVAKGQRLTNLEVYLVGKGTVKGDQDAVSSDLPYGFYQSDGVNHYTDAPGSTYTGWLDSEGSRYYVKDSAFVAGWQYIEGLKFYFNAQGRLVQNLDSVIGNQTSYKIRINKELNCLTVFAKDGDNGYIVPVKSMLCSVGDDTPLGTFTSPEKYRWRLMVNDTYTQYATRITAGFLIHSICYDKPDIYTMQSVGYNGLGTVRSLGCIRLTAANAKWVYDYCPIGTTIEIYEDAVTPGPFYRPVVEPIPEDQTWDPTDPMVSDEYRAESARKTEETKRANPVQADVLEQPEVETAPVTEAAANPGEAGPGKYKN